VRMRVAPEAGLADRIYGRAASNNFLPIVEMMWGLPGSMLACVHMHRMTGEERFGALFRSQAARLLDDLEAGDRGAPVWTQDLYGKQQRWLGAVHGFAGNMLPLIHGWDWLDDGQRGVVADAAMRTLAAHAERSELGATWPAVMEGSGSLLCQHCHGAPGMVTVFADAPFSGAEFEKLLVGGGELTWRAGALVKGSNLCHGTGGNGYAFLKLYRRSRDAVWLERARAFAMASIDQVRGARAAFGRGRYSVWTGDVGLAVYLWDCITGDAGFPTVDVL
jgi:hypothetical protein